MNVGDLVRYRRFTDLSPLKHLVGLVVEINTFLYLEKVLVRWNAERPQGNLVWDYMDELEKIDDFRQKKQNNKTC